MIPSVTTMSTSVGPMGEPTWSNRQCQEYKVENSRTKHDDTLNKYASFGEAFIALHMDSFMQEL